MAGSPGRQCARRLGSPWKTQTSVRQVSLGESASDLAQMWWRPWVQGRSGALLIPRISLGRGVLALFPPVAGGGLPHRRAG